MSTRAPAVPPVNAVVTQVSRAGSPIWIGSAPAFSRRRQEWVPTSTGNRISTQTTELTVPPLDLGPVNVPPPGDYPTPPPPPPPVDPPPPPPPEGYPDAGYPYVPPSTVPPPVVPPVGSYAERLHATFGFPGGQTFARLNWSSGGFPVAGIAFAWTEALTAATDPKGTHAIGGSPRDNRGPYGGAGLYPQTGLFQLTKSAGGLHWRLGTPNGLIDQSGENNHGYAVGGVYPGLMDGIGTAGDPLGAAYFDGTGGVIVSNLNPFMIGAPDADNVAACQAAWGPGSSPSSWGASADHYALNYTDIAPYGFAGYIYGTGPAYTYETYPVADDAGTVTEQGTFTEHAGWVHDTPATVLQPYTRPTVIVTGWVRRQDTTHNNTLFCSSGPDPYRLYLPAGSRRPVWECPRSADSGGAGTGASGAASFQWANDAWPANQDQWVHYAFVIPPASVNDSAPVLLYVNGVQIAFANPPNNAYLLPVPQNLKQGTVAGLPTIVPADHGAICAGCVTDSWKGGMDDFAVLVHRGETSPRDYSATQNWTFGSFSYNTIFGALAKPRPAIAGGSVAVDPTLAPTVGDRITYTHAGVEYTIKVDGVDERADFGYYRLTSAGA